MLEEFVLQKHLEKVNLNWFTHAKEQLISAVIALLNSECDNALPDLPQYLCFLRGVKKMAKCVLSGHCHRPCQG